MLREHIYQVIEVSEHWNLLVNLFVSERQPFKCNLRQNHQAKACIKNT